MQTSVGCGSGSGKRLTSYPCDAQQCNIVVARKLIAAYDLGSMGVLGTTKVRLLSLTALPCTASSHPSIAVTHALLMCCQAARAVSTWLLALVDCPLSSAADGLLTSAPEVASQ